MQPKKQKDPLSYPNGVLKNSHHFHTWEELFDIEEKTITSLLLNSQDILIEINPCLQSSLNIIHSLLYGSIYEWAGIERTRSLNELGVDYCPGKYIKEKLEKVFSSNFNTFEEIMYAFNFLNAIRPYVRGNGAVFRVWLNLMLYNKYGKHVNYDGISVSEYMLALIEEFDLKGEHQPKLLIELFKKNLIEIKSFDDQAWIDFQNLNAKAIYKYEHQQKI